MRDSRSFCLILLELLTSGVRVTRSLVLCVCFVDRCLSFCIFSFGIVLSVLLRYTDSDYPFAGADPGFQVRGAHLNKLHRAEGGANIFGIFRVKNHDFTPKNLIFFFNFRGGARRVRPPPPESAPALVSSNSS